jgi:hypothetical protein
MLTEQLTTQPQSLRGPLPPLTRAKLIMCIAVVSQGLANNADPNSIIDDCYSPPLAQSPRDSIPQFERAS